MNVDIGFQALGECAITLETRAPVSLAIQRRIWAVAEQFRQHSGVLEVVPGMNNLTLQFDPFVCSGDELQDALASAWQQTRALALAGRERVIPVSYGGEDGPDLALVAQHCGLSVAELVARHTAGCYQVFFVGFQPGFAYLGGLAPELAVPRRAEPRLRVPAGSVAIGGAQTGIYPQACPGGWQLIGRTDLCLFDPAREEPSLLLPGDRVRFEAREVRP